MIDSHGTIKPLPQPRIHTFQKRSRSLHTNLKRILVTIRKNVHAPPTDIPLAAEHYVQSKKPSFLYPPLLPCFAPVNTRTPASSTSARPSSDLSLRCHYPTPDSLIAQFDLMRSLFNEPFFPAAQARPVLTYLIKSTVTSHPIPPTSPVRYQAQKASHAFTCVQLNNAISSRPSTHQPLSHANPSSPIISHKATQPIFVPNSYRLAHAENFCNSKVPWNGCSPTLALPPTTSRQPDMGKTASSPLQTPYLRYQVRDINYQNTDQAETRKITDFSSYSLENLYTRHAPFFDNSRPKAPPKPHILTEYFQPTNK